MSGNSRIEIDISYDDICTVKTSDRGLCEKFDAFCEINPGEWKLIKQDGCIKTYQIIQESIIILGPSVDDGEIRSIAF